MTNEEKALDIIFGWADDVHECAKDAAMEMAEWKDQQFKEYLEKKKEEVIKKMKEHILYSQPEEFYHNRVMFCSEIINELFGETEQDNTDREE